MDFGLVISQDISSLRPLIIMLVGLFLFITSDIWFVEVMHVLSESTKYSLATVEKIEKIYR